MPKKTFSKKLFSKILTGFIFAFIFFFFTPQVFAGTISSCDQILAGPMTYTLTQSIGTAGQPCLQIFSPGVIITDGGNNYSINGNINADANIYTGPNGQSFTVAGNTKINGNISSQGSSGGSLGTVTFNDSSSNAGSINGNVILNNSSSNIGSVSGTITANGLTGWDGTHYYVGGVSTQGDLNSNGTGYWTSAHGGDNTYYISGTAHSGLDSSGTGWDGSNYYMNAVVTGLNSSGTGYSDPSNGGDGYYYIGGTSTGNALNSSGTGYWNGNYYIGGVSTQGDLNSNGTGYWTSAHGGDNNYYINGGSTNGALNSDGKGWWNEHYWIGDYYFNNLNQYGNGWDGTYYYIGGNQTTLSSSGSGCNTGLNGDCYYYSNGGFVVHIVSSVGGGTGLGENSTYYVNGNSTEGALSTNGNGSWNNHYYINGHITTLSSSGYGYWSASDGGDDNYYVQGVSTNGALDSSGNGWWTDWNSNSYYYVGGQRTSLDQNSGGNGYSSIDGHNIYYISNQATTLDSNGNGFWNNGYYQNAQLIASGKVWTGGVNGDWNNTANWQGGIVATTSGNILLASSITLRSDITNNIYVAADNVTINGGSSHFTIHGNVTNVLSYAISISNAHVTGDIASAGVWNGSNGADSDVNNNGQDGGAGGSSGNITVASSTVDGNILTANAGNGGNGGGSVNYSGGNGGAGGSSGGIGIENSTVNGTVITGNAGSPGSGGSGGGVGYNGVGGSIGSVGSINIVNSNVGTVLSGNGSSGAVGTDGSYGGGLGNGGNTGGSGGSISISSSTIGTITSGNGGTGGDAGNSNGGALDGGGGGNGGSSGSISIINNSHVGTVTAGTGGQGGNGTPGTTSSGEIPDGSGGGAGGSGSITITDSTTGGISSSGGNGGQGGAGSSGTFGGNGGQGGAGGDGDTITITNSITRSITYNTGQGGAGGAAGSGNTGINGINGNAGVVTISGSNVNLSGISISADTLSVTYTDSLITAGTNLSLMSSLTVHDPNITLGPVSYAGGSFPLFPGTITTGGNIIFPGTYTLGSDLSSGISVETNGVTIDGSGSHFTIHGGVVGLIGFPVSISNVHVTGNVSSVAGGSSGDITVASSTVDGSISTGDGEVGGSSGSISITNSTTTSATTGTGGVGVNGLNATGNGNTGDGGGTGGSSGGITIIDSVVTNLYTGYGSTGGVGGNGGNGGNGGSSGSISITNSTTSSLTVGLPGVGGNRGGAATGGNDGNDGNVGNSGSIVFVGTTLDLSGKTINSGAGDIGGPVTLSYSGLKTSTSTNIFTHTANLTINNMSYGPWNGVFNPKIYYFSDGQGNEGRLGDWGDVKNWWTDLSFTAPADSVPAGFNNIIINNGHITQDTTGTASANTITLTGSSTITIPVTLANGAVFRDSSSNATTTATSSQSEIIKITINGTYSDFSSAGTGSITFGNSTFNYGDVDTYTNDSWVDTTAGATDFASYISNNLSTGGTISSNENVVTITIPFGSTSGLSWTTDNSNLIGIQKIQGGLSGSSGIGQITSNGPITFNGGSSNNSLINSGNNPITFNASSSNNSLIVTDATTTFNGDLASSTGLIQNSQGGTSSPITRIYTQSVSTVRNFLTEAGHNNWIVVAKGAAVDISNAVYSTATNIFKAIIDPISKIAGSFFWGNNSGGQVVPQITVASTTLAYDPSNASTTKTIKWNPHVNWDTASTCIYSYNSDFSNPINTTCSNNDTSLQRPSVGEHTLYLRGTDSRGNVRETSIYFYYDNTSPVWTSCGVNDPLDENRTYYLANDVTGSCNVTSSAATTTILGAKAGTTPSYKVNGNIVGNGHNLSIQNIIVTGTIDSSGQSSGANGGNISIATSTTGAITSNGLDGSTRGGNGGTITIWNSDAFLAGALVTSNGGNASSCSGTAGNGGNITITNSDNYTPVSNGGSITGSCSGSTHHGGAGSTQTETRSQYTANNSNNNSSNNNSSSNNTMSHSGGSSNTYKFIPNPFVTYTDNNIHKVNLDINMPSELKLSDLPTFGGTGIKSFDFSSLVSKFLFAPLPKSITDALKKAPRLGEFIASAGLSREQDLVSLIKHPILISAPDLKNPPAGLFVVTSGTSTLPSYLTGDKTHPIMQLVRTTSDKALKISLVPDSKGKVQAVFQEKIIDFTVNKTIAYTYIMTPTEPGRYILTTSSSPIPLVIEVKAPPAPPVPPPKPFSVVDWVVGWFR